jgi:hypothetical protein
MSARQMIDVAAAAGIRLAAEGEKLIAEYEGEIPAAVVADLKRHKAEILQILASDQKGTSLPATLSEGQETVPRTSAVDRAVEYHRRRIAAKEDALAWQGLGPDGKTPLAEYQRLAAEGAKTARAENFLLAELANGPKAAKAIQLAAEEAGYAMRTIERAKAAIGIASTKHASGDNWYWALPEGRQAGNDIKIEPNTPLAPPAPTNGPWPEPKIVKDSHFGADEVPSRYEPGWQALLASRPRWATELQWETAIFSCRDLFAEWGAELLRLNWRPEDIFHQWHGLGWFLKGQKVVFLGPHHAFLEDGRVFERVCRWPRTS